MSGNLKITILGCGSSGGVPRVGGDWGACDPDEPKNRRSRSSILVEYWQDNAKGNWDAKGDTVPPEHERTVVLIDTAPDLRAQLLSAKVKHIDAVCYTHDHGDQTHGIDDLRAIAYKNRARIPTYMGQDTKDDLLMRFGYCFEKPSGRVHAPILELQDVIKDGDFIEITGAGGSLPIRVFEVGHGTINAFGFVFGTKVAYSPDCQNISDETLESLVGLDLWIVDALRYHKHPTHAHMDKSLQWGAETRIKKMVFTNMHIDVDYQTLNRELIGPHEPAYDGMTIKVKLKAST